MYAKEQGQFAQFFEDVEEIVHTPSRTTSRVVVSSARKTPSATPVVDTTVVMTPRMEIMLRKEKKAREEEANLTFQPHVNRNASGPGHSASRTSLSGQESANRFDALYSDALKRHLETKWKESSDQKELTFTPKITERGGRSRASSRNGSRQGSRASSPGPATESAIDRLHSTQKGKLKHGVDPDNQLTFKPEITKRAMSIDRKETAKRLYAPNSIDKEKAKSAMREMEARERELENCTFSPEIKTNPKFAPKEKIDLRERMSRFEEMKKAKLQERQKQQLEQELADATFKPTLQSKTKRAPTPTKPFHERLAQPFERHGPTDAEKELNASMTFKPTLVTKRSASPNGRASEYNSVHERLYKEGEQRKKETQLALEALKLEAETNFTFSPEINHNSKVAAPEAGPVFERLATSTSKQYMQEVLMKVKTELELKDCTFHPKLSTEHHKYLPKDGTENTPVHERLNQEAELKRQEKERLEQLRLENALKHHTFAPQIPESSKSMASMRGSFVGSPDGGAGGGSVSVGGDDIFARLNAQSTIAKSPHLVDPNLTNKSPTKTRSIIISEEERNKLYERLAAPPKTLSFSGNMKSPSGADDERSSVNNRKSAQQIDDVVNRLHATHTKAKQAPAFTEPAPLHALLRTNSMSNSNTPNGSPDKSLSRRNSMSSEVPGAPNASPQPKRMMSMSLTMSPPSSLVRAGSVKTMVPPSPAAKESSPSGMQRTGSVKTMTPTPAAAASEASTVKPRAVATKPAAGAEDSAPKVVPRKPSQSSMAAPAPAAAPAPVSKPATLPPSRPAAKSAASSGAGSDDFLSKIEASMNMLTMNPAQLVAQQQGLPIPPASVTAPSPVPVAVQPPPAVEPEPTLPTQEQGAAAAGAESAGTGDEDGSGDDDEEVVNVEGEF